MMRGASAKTDSDRRLVSGGKKMVNPGVFSFAKTAQEIRQNRDTTAYQLLYHERDVARQMVIEHQDEIKTLLDPLDSDCAPNLIDLKSYINRHNKQLSQRATQHTKASIASKFQKESSTFTNNQSSSSPKKSPRKPASRPAANEETATMATKSAPTSPVVTRRSRKGVGQTESNNVSSADKASTSQQRKTLAELEKELIERRKVLAEKLKMMDKNDKVHRAVYNTLLKKKQENALVAQALWDSVRSAHRDLLDTDEPTVGAEKKPSSDTPKLAKLVSELIENNRQKNKQQQHPHR